MATFRVIPPGGGDPIEFEGTEEEVRAFVENLERQQQTPAQMRANLAGGLATALNVGLPSAGEIAGNLGGTLIGGAAGGVPGAAAGRRIGGPAGAATGAGLASLLQGEGLSRALREGGEAAAISGAFQGAGNVATRLAPRVGQNVPGPIGRFLRSRGQAGTASTIREATRELGEQVNARLDPTESGRFIRAALERRRDAITRRADQLTSQAAKITEGRSIVSKRFVKEQLERIAEEQRGEPGREIALEALKKVEELPENFPILKANRVRSGVVQQFRRIFDNPTDQSKSALNEVQSVFDDAMAEAAQKAGKPEAAELVRTARGMRALRNQVFTGNRPKDLKLDRLIETNPDQVADFIIRSASPKDIQAIKANSSNAAFQRVQSLLLQEIDELGPDRIARELNRARQGKLRARLRAALGDRVVKNLMTGARGSAALRRGNPVRLFIPAANASNLRRMTATGMTGGAGALAARNPLTALAGIGAVPLAGALEFAVRTPGGRTALRQGTGQAFGQLVDETVTPAQALSALAERRGGQR